VTTEWVERDKERTVSPRPDRKKVVALLELRRKVLFMTKRVGHEHTK